MRYILTLLGAVSYIYILCSLCSLGSSGWHIHMGVPPHAYDKGRESGVFRTTIRMGDVLDQGRMGG